MMKRSHCQASALPIDLPERKIEEYYKTIALPPELRRALQEAVTAEFAGLQAEAAERERRLGRQRRQLEERRKKLLDAHLSGAVPVDLLKSEQDAIKLQLDQIEETVAAASTATVVVEANLETALSLAENCYETYRRASHQQRRELNQAMFERILVHQDIEIDGRLAQPFETLLDPQLLASVSRGRGSTSGESAAGNAKPRPWHSHGRGSKAELLVDLRVSGFLTSVTGDRSLVSRDMGHSPMHVEVPGRGVEDRRKAALHDGGCCRVRNLASSPPSTSRPLP
jgi:hypothetical protein